MIITSTHQLNIYKEATQISTEILAQMRDMVAPGVYPLEIDQRAEQLCKKYGVKSSFKGVINGRLRYQYNSCISVNNEILHGIPSKKRALQKGDLVKLDFGIIHKGFFTDQCVTVGVQKVDSQDQQLLQTGKQAVLAGVAQALHSNHTGDIGHAMHSTAYRQGYDVLKEYVGHGIGHSLHEDPEIPAYGQPGKGSRLQKNMIICVEAQVVPGSDEVFTTENGWTVKTVDQQKGVMFEYMVLVGKKPQILTPTTDWPLITAS